MPTREDAQGHLTATLRVEPPLSPAQTLFRVILRFLPTGFAVLCVIGMDFLARYGLSSGWNVVTWYLVTSAFTIGAGWYNALLSHRAKLEPDGVFGRTVLFWFIQHFLVPLLLAMRLFLARVFDPIKFGGH